MSTQREKMVAGEIYDPLDPGLVVARARARDCYAVGRMHQLMRTFTLLLVVAVAASPWLAIAAANLPVFKVERWVNSPPLTPEALRGKVVLVDFWEYTCVNWIRTAPYVKAWHRDYAALGVVVVGVHAPLPVRPGSPPGLRETVAWDRRYSSPPPALLSSSAASRPCPTWL